MNFCVNTAQKNNARRPCLRQDGHKAGNVHDALESDIAAPIMGGMPKLWLPVFFDCRYNISKHQTSSDDLVFGNVFDDAE